MGKGKGADDMSHKDRLVKVREQVKTSKMKNTKYRTMEKLRLMFHKWIIQIFLKTKIQF